MNFAMHGALFLMIIALALVWGPFPRIRARIAYLFSGDRTIDRAVARTHRRRKLASK